MTDQLPRWSVADVYESLDGRAFAADLESLRADIDRLVAMFETHDVRSIPPRPATADDGRTADDVLRAYNRVADALTTLRATVMATVATDSRNEHAQSLQSELGVLTARTTPLLARLADWVAALGVDRLAGVSVEAADHRGPLRQLAERASHQMPESDEALYADLATTGSDAWARLHRDLTSQLDAIVTLPDGSAPRLPMPAVRGLATSTDPAVRRAAYEAELVTWPEVATAAAAALNAIKGEACTVNRRRGWASPLEASLFANNVSRPVYDAMQAAIVDSLDDFRRWMRVKAGLLGHHGAMPWWDLVAPSPTSGGELTWDDGIGVVRSAFESYGPHLAHLVDRALDERWIDAEARPGKTGGAFCMSFTGDRSLILLNWSGSAESAQTTAHEIGHAYHNTVLARRTALQRRLPMALAETASIFCETLVVEAGLQRAHGNERLALLEVDLQGANQIVVDIHSRLLFETEVFTRRERRTLGVSELDELMLEAQAAAYGDGLDQATAHPSMWIVKPHYYGSHFYNWPYTYGLLFGLGLFQASRVDPERFRDAYDDLLSRAGMDTADELGRAFGLDVADESFWQSSLDVLRARMTEYADLASTYLASTNPLAAHPGAFDDHR